MLTFIFVILFLVWLAASAVTILVVLMQSGRGGGLSGLAGGGGGTIGSNISATGAEKTLNRWTTYCASGFMVLTILLVLLGDLAFQPETLDLGPAVAPTEAPADVTPAMDSEEATPEEGVTRVTEPMVIEGGEDGQAVQLPVGGAPAETAAPETGEPEIPVPAEATN